MAQHGSKDKNQTLDNKCYENSPFERSMNALESRMYDNKKGLHPEMTFAPTLVSFTREGK